MCEDSRDVKQVSQVQPNVDATVVPSTVNINLARFKSADIDCGAIAAADGTTADSFSDFGGALPGDGCLNGEATMQHAAADAKQDAAAAALR